MEVCQYVQSSIIKKSYKYSILQKGVGDLKIRHIFMYLNNIIKEPYGALLIYSFVLIFGILVGSFLNVLILRIPKGEEFVKTSSHCMSCGHKLAWYDNIPLLSWVFLRGKCRYCQEKISIQYPLIEGFNGLLWLSVFLIKGISIDSLLISLMSSGLLALSVIDWRTYEIANGFHVFFLFLGLIKTITDKEYLNHVIGFFVISVLLLGIYVISKGRAIGGGDVKLMAACGFFLGYKETVVAFLIGCVVGSIVHLIRMKKSKINNVLAMGPYLSIGIFIASLFGHQIITWYLSLFQM